MKAVKRWAAIIIADLAGAAALLSGCGEEKEQESAFREAAPVEETAALQDTQDAETEDTEAVEETDDASGVLSSILEDDGDDVLISGDEDTIQRDGVYDQKDDVALYIWTYGDLPENYITKKEARELGWEGGSLEPYAPGKCIGGDRFGNYEGILPEDADYHECDIDTLGKSSRGAKRIVYSNDGKIWYTEDHYETFDLLLEGGANR